MLYSIKRLEYPIPIVGLNMRPQSEAGFFVTNLVKICDRNGRNYLWNCFLEVRDY